MSGAPRSAARHAGPTQRAPPAPAARGRARANRGAVRARRRYDADKREALAVKNLQLLAAIGSETGGHAVRRRLRVRLSRAAASALQTATGLVQSLIGRAHAQAPYASVGMAAADDAQLRRIFTALMTANIADFDDAVKPLGTPPRRRSPARSHPAPPASRPRRGRHWRTPLRQRKSAFCAAGTNS